MRASLPSRTARTAALLIAGAVAGPIILALVSASLSRTYGGLAAAPEGAFNYSSGEAAALLFRAYEPYRPLPRFRTNFDLPQITHWADCGYPAQLDSDPKLLTGTMRAARDMAQPGQRALAGMTMARGITNQEDAAVAKLDQATSTFSAVFLRRCIESTLARKLCVAEVTERLQGDSWERYPYLELATDRETRCLLLDGVAVRNGLPLADRPVQLGEAGDRGQGGS